MNQEDLDERTRKNRLAIEYLTSLGYRYIASEVLVPLASRTADLVLYRDEAMRSPLVVVECKSVLTDEPHLLSPGVQQAFSVATALGDQVRYLLITDGIRYRWFERDPDRQSLVPMESAPTPLGPTDGPFGLPLAPVTSPDQFLHLVQEVSQLLRRENSVFSLRLATDLNRILIAKLRDEERAARGEKLEFQTRGNRPEQVAQRIVRLFEEAFERLGGPTPPEPAWTVGPSTLYNVVAFLEPYFFGSVPREARDKLFWQVFPSLLPKDAVSHITPPALAWMLIRLVRPTASERVLDPACGTGSLLIESHHQMALSTGPGKLGNLLGIEINAEAAALARTNLALARLPPRQVLLGDSLSQPSLEAMRISRESFDVIVTNPPIGKPPKALISDLELARARSTPLEALFLEVSARLLRPGGRMGVVVPDSLLTSPAYRRVREWLLDRLTIRALIGLPSNTLTSIGYSGMASILLLEKPGSNATEIPVLIADLDAVGDGSDEERREGHLYQAVAAFSDYLQGQISASELSQRPEVQLLGHAQLHDSGFNPRLWRSGLARTKYPMIALGELAEIFGGRNYRKHVPPGPDTALLIQAGTVRELHMDTSAPRYISLADYASAGRTQLRSGDVLVTTTGQYLGRSAVFESQGLPATISGAVTVLRPRERVTAHYLAVLLNSQLMREQIERLQATSTAQPYIRRADLAKVVVPVPPLPVQREIADEVRGLNLQANELTEQARSLKERAKRFVLQALESDLR